MPDAALLAVLESLRERGALGEPSLPRAIAHAEAFVVSVPTAARRLIDLGSGGGLPGLVLAVQLPAIQVVLTDRRERRMDLLRLACSRLGIADRVTVITGDVTRLAELREYAGQFDVVTARSFGEPLWTLDCALPFLSVDGVIIVSEPPSGDVDVRWPPADLASRGLGVRGGPSSTVRCFERTHPAQTAQRGSL